MTTAERLTPADALELLRSAGTADLMARADAVRRARHGARTYFVHSLNLNPTNVCENRCDLCAFWRERDADDAYVTTVDQACDVFEHARALNLTDIHIVGGLLPELDLAYYEELIRSARRILPSVLVQGLTAVEIHYLAEREGITVDAVLQRLKTAGLGAIPGGGAEILSDRVRSKICEHKISADQWLDVHARAHAAGLPSNATMLFGHVETDEECVEHLTKIRELQDRTGGFQAFIPLAFYPTGTAVQVDRGPSGDQIARVVAVSRLFLDNIPHVRVLVNYTDPKLLQVLTHGGVDDVGGTSLDERIARAAGAPDKRRFGSVGQIESFLAQLDLEPVLVNSAYEPVTAEEPGTALPAAPEDDADVAAAIERAECGDRLSAEDAILLHDRVPFSRLGHLAHAQRMKRVPGNRITYVIDRNLSITNVCEAGCRFCAFYVDPGAEGAFTLSIDEIVQQVRDAVAAGATQVMLQGGLNPDLELGFYEEMLRRIKAACDVCIHSLTATEVYTMARRSGLSVHDVLQRLMEAGLDSLPGGGAELLVDDVRRRVSPRKITADQWCEVMRIAHTLNLPTTATMVYGMGETTEQRVEHLMRIRDLQDEGHGFTAFIPWSFQPNRTDLEMPAASGVEYLRIMALARLVLDNIDHFQAGWVTEGPDLAQLALTFGADDFGGVLMEEKVVRATGVSYDVNLERIISAIEDLGMTPTQRTTQYELLA